MIQVDATYRSQRMRLRSVLLATVARHWAVASPHDQGAFLGRVTAVVLAAQAQSVRLVDAYMATKTKAVIGTGAVKGLDPSLYTVDAIRGVPAAEVYSRPFGALGYALETGLDFSAARAAGGAALGRLASTDFQLAQTYSARDWMTSEESITGYERILGGDGCELCQAAADGRVFATDDLAPIHDHCGCSVSPVFGPEPTKGASDVFSVESDPELGQRLVAA